VTARKGVIMNPEGYEPAQLHRNFTGVHLCLPACHEMHAAVISAEAVEEKGKRVSHERHRSRSTIAHLLGTPIPKNAEGNVLKEFLYGRS